MFQSRAVSARRRERPWAGRFGQRDGGGYGLVRVALGVILLVAAGLKAHQLATDPFVTLAPQPLLLAPFLQSRLFLIGIVEFELLLGLLLLSGILPRLTWASSLLCFGAFALVSLYKALSGDASCGCFGKMPINPWYTGALDLAIVVSLLRWRPRGLSRPYFPTFGRSAAVFAIWLSVGLPAAFAMDSLNPATLAQDGVIVGDGNLVILEPQKWVGRRFPLSPYIEEISKSVKPGQPPLRERLLEGEWFVVLYRHGCPKCQKLLERYRRNAERGKCGVGQGITVAIIEIPPVAEATSMDWCEFGTLNDAYRWFLRAPIGIYLRHGVVELASEEVSEVAKRFLGEAPQKWEEYKSLLRAYELRERTTIEVMHNKTVEHDTIRTVLGDKDTEIVVHLRRTGEQERLYGVNADYEFVLQKGPDSDEPFAIHHVGPRNPNQETYALRNREYFVRSIWWAFPLDFHKIVGSPGFRVKDATDAIQDRKHVVRITFEYALTNPGPKEKTLPKAFAGTAVFLPDTYWALSEVKMRFDDPVKEVSAIEMDNTIGTPVRGLPLVARTEYRWYDLTGKLWRRAVSNYEWTEFTRGDDAFTLSAYGFPEPAFPQPRRVRLWLACISIAAMLLGIAVFAFRRRQKT